MSPSELPPITNLETDLEQAQRRVAAFISDLDARNGVNTSWVNSCIRWAAIERRAAIEEQNIKELGNLALQTV